MVLRQAMETLVGSSDKLGCFFVASVLFAPELALATPPVLAPELLSNESFAEQFSAMADLEDGTYVQVQLGVSNVGPGDGKGGCRLLVVEPGGATFADDVVIDRERWRYVNGAEPTLEMGECRAKAKGDRLVFTTRIKGAKLELSLFAPPAKTRKHVHEVKIGGEFYELEVLVPWARADVRYELPGKAARKLAGYAYADHSRSTTLPGKLASKWVRFRGLKDGSSVVALVRYSADDKPEGWLWSEKNGRVTLERFQVLSRPGMDKKSRQWRALLDGPGGPWRVTSGELLHRFAPLEERGMFGAVVGSVVGNPVTYTHRGMLEEKESRLKLQGIFEVTLTDE